MTSNREQAVQRRSAKAFVSHFQDKIRAECAEISKQRRQALLQKHRNTTDPCTSSEHMQAELRQVARERAAHLLHSGGLGPSCSAWGAEPATTRSPSPSGQALQQPGSGLSSSSLTPGSGPSCRSYAWEGLGADEAEVLSEEAVLQLLEEQLYTSLIAEELELIEREQQMQVEAMGAEYEQQGHAGCMDSGSVLCPVCGRCALVQLHGVVACPLERWQLDLRVESLSLEDLRGRLSGAYESHTSCSWGCPGSLVFKVVSAFDCPQLQAQCSTCSFMHLVI